MPRRYTEQQFRGALADPAVQTMADLCRALGLVPRGANYETLRRYAARLDIQLDLPGGRARKHPVWQVPSKAFEAAVRSSRSIGAVLRALGERPTSSGYRNVRQRIANLGLDTEHFQGQGWADGRTFPERWLPIEQFLARGYKTGSDIRERLIVLGIREHRCERCRRREWEGQPIPLELDHIDGRRDNNRLDNLRLLCPNCHALTPTYRGRNIGRYEEGQPGCASL